MKSQIQGIFSNKATTSGPCCQTLASLASNLLREMRNNTKAGGGSFGVFFGWQGIWGSRGSANGMGVCVMRKQSGEDVKV